MHLKEMSDDPVALKDRELRAKMRALYTRDQFGIHDRVLEFHDRLKAKYPDYRRCRRVHLISGSTIQPPYATLDFPGEDSVENFINREYERVFGQLA